MLAVDDRSDVLKIISANALAGTDDATDALTIPGSDAAVAQMKQFVSAAKDKTHDIYGAAKAKAQGIYGTAKEKAVDIYGAHPVVLDTEFWQKARKYLAGHQEGGDKCKPKPNGV